MKTKTRARPTVITTDAEIDAALTQAKLYDRYRPRAISARYLAGLDIVVITLASGVELRIPRKQLQGLENADARDVAKIELSGHGSSLHWEELDVDHYIPGLIEGVLGTRRWMAEIGHKGGSARSRAKVLSSRANGKRGGRPKARL